MGLKSAVDYPSLCICPIACSFNVMKAAELSVAFFFQMFFILAVARLVGGLGRRVGQPQVVGEMIAGVAMGPSLFGYFFPGAQALIFPKESLSLLFVCAQLGVGVYMFLVGLEFQTAHFRGKIRSAASVSIAGMLAPFIMGGIIAAALIKVPGIFSEKTRLFEAVLFLGSAMSITAFPMLARIIHERGISGTALGTLALAAGAIDDAAAWCVLAVVLASFGGGAIVAVKAIGGGVLFAVLMVLFGTRCLAPLSRMVEGEGRLTERALGVVLMLLMLSAWVTDMIGIHAVFGGFLLGVVMPRGLLVTELRRVLQPFVVVFLLPIFFCYSGLNTRLDMVNSPTLLGIAMVVLLAAILGKGGACWAAARLNGEDNRTALGVGTLMNARGLMELIILNIGLQAGVIQPALFAIMVLMAIVTTLMTSPVFEWVYGRSAAKAKETAPEPAVVGG